MFQFFTLIVLDLRRVSWRMALLFVGTVVAIYGMLVVAPATAFDFASAKGSGFKVFLTYYFMHRPIRGFISAFFPNYTPFWNASAGIVFLVLSVYFVYILFLRMQFSCRTATLGALLFISTPFFFNFSVYQHVMPAGAVAFCFDAIAFLSFHSLINHAERRFPVAAVSIVASAMATGIYQAHANLLLTGMLGICALSARDNFKDFGKDVFYVWGVLSAAVLVWGIVCFGPIALAKLMGVVVPQSGGCHDEIYWFSDSHTLLETIKALGVGLLVNWVYNAFFIVGLRCVLVIFCLCICISCGLALKHRWAAALAVFLFVFSPFAFPVLQGTAANLRTHYCLIPLICFGGLLILRSLDERRGIRSFAFAVLAFCTFEMGQETATLYYYNWKLKHHDEMHMAVIAHDLWAKYGMRVEKPVAVLGGWKDVNTCWDDMRPFQDLPLVNRPYTTYSNVNDDNVAREFYMVAREKVGLVVQMPDADVYNVMRGDKDFQDRLPRYPQDGYVSETNGIIVVNLGTDRSPWPAFRYKNYLSPNEKLLDRSLGIERRDAWLFRMTSFCREWAARYPWAVNF